MLLPIAHFCFPKVTYKYYMPLSRVADAKLLNLDKIIQKLHDSMGYSIKQLYSSYSYISSGLLIWV